MKRKKSIQNYICSRFRSYLLAIILMAGCGGGAGLGLLVSALSGGSALPSVVPPLFTAGAATMPSVLLPFTSELKALAITPDGTKLYACDTLHNTVSVFNLTNNEAIDILDVESSPAFIAITPDGSTAYVSNSRSDSVSIIDIIKDEVTETLSVGDNPFGIAITPDSSKVYVANRSSNDISVIDAENNQLISEISVGARPTFIAITPDGEKAYVANSGGNTVSVLGVKADAVISSITVGENPNGIASAIDGSKVYVANSVSGTVSVLGVETDEVVANLDTGTGPTNIVVSPDGTRVYVANALGEEDCGTFENTLSVIDVDTNSVIAKGIEVGEAPLGVVITGDGEKAYAFSACSNTLSLLNTSLILNDISNSVTTITIKSQSRSTGIVIAPDSSHVYIAHPNSISVLDVANDSVIAAIPARGSGPTALAVTPDGSRLYTVNSGSDTVSVVDINNDEHVATLSVGSRPSDIAITPDGLKAYVTNSGFSRLPDNTVSVIDIGNNNTISTLSELAIGPIRVAITPNGAKALVVHFGNFFPTDSFKNNIVTIIDAENDEILDQVDLSENVPATDVELLFDSSKAIVSSFLAPNSLFNLSQIDLTLEPPVVSTTPTLITEIDSPINLAITSDGSKAIVANYVGANLAILDVPVNIISATIPTNGPNPSVVAIMPDDSKAYILNSGDRSFQCDLEPCIIGNTASVLDLEANPPSLSSTIDVGKRPVGIAITPDGAKVYVSNFFEDTVSVISSETDTVTKTLSVGVAPVDVVITPNGLKAYVANSVSKTVSVIEVGSDTVIGSVNVEP